jgi:hypothetical protein
LWTQSWNSAVRFSSRQWSSVAWNTEHRYVPVEGWQTETACGHSPETQQSGSALANGPALHETQSWCCCSHRPSKQKYWTVIKFVWKTEDQTLEKEKSYVFLLKIFSLTYRFRTHMKAIRGTI